MKNLSKKTFRIVGALNFFNEAFVVPAGVTNMRVLFKKDFMQDAFFNTNGIDQFGNVFSWGRGPIGDALSANSIVPKDITATIGRPLRKPFLQTDGRMVNWGDNTFGQLGGGAIGGSNNNPTPTPGMLAIKKLFRGETCYALKENGDLYAWGKNTDGQVGDGTVANTGTPFLVLQNVVDFWPDSQTRSPRGCFAKTSDNQLWAWGADPGTWGSLGNGATGGQLSPVQVSGGLNFVKVDRCGKATNSHTIGLTIDGDAYTWGYGANGELGNGANGNSNVPVLVSGGNKYQDVQAGADFCLALTTVGVPLSWGSSALGQLGSGLVNKNVPTGITNLGGGVSKIYVNVQAAHVIDLSGKLFSWGNQSANFPVLGVGDNVLKSAPTAVTGVVGRFEALALPLEGFMVHAITNRGTRYAWGDNTDGDAATQKGTLGVNSTALRINTATLVQTTVAFVGPTITGNVNWKPPTNEPEIYEKAVTPGSTLSINLSGSRANIPELDLHSDQFCSEIELQWMG